MLDCRGGYSCFFLVFTASQRLQEAWFVERFCECEVCSICGTKACPSSLKRRPRLGGLLVFFWLIIFFSGPFVVCVWLLIFIGFWKVLKEHESPSLVAFVWVFSQALDFCSEFTGRLGGPRVFFTPWTERNSRCTERKKGLESWRFSGSFTYQHISCTLIQQNGPLLALNCTELAMGQTRVHQKPYWLKEKRPKPVVFLGVGIFLAQPNSWPKQDFLSAPLRIGSSRTSVLRSSTKWFASTSTCGTRRWARWPPVGEPGGANSPAAFWVLLFGGFWPFCL